MNFQEACEATVKQSKEENRLCYLYKNRIGNFTWGVSHQYWKDWLFKAYPGGRKVLSVEGTKLMQSESGPTPVAADKKACRADHAKLQAMRLAPKYCPECGEQLSCR